MKKLIILTSLVTIFCLACNQKPAPEKDEAIVAETSSENLNLIGFWVGQFEAKDYKKDAEYVYSNRLNIAIKAIIGDDVTAQSIVAGNSRLLKGKILRKDGKVTFELAEPGDDKYDGKFEFELINNKLVGFWESFDKNLAVTKRIFELERKEFVYDANLMLPENDYMDRYSGKDKQVTDTIDGEPETYTDKFYRASSESVYTINSSTHEFTEKELKNYKKLDLEILRNTIFARHGYSFKKKGYRQFFDHVDWYIPVTANVDGELTALEKANIKLFQRFEKYAEDNYDTFGR